MEEEHKHIDSGKVDSKPLFRPLKTVHVQDNKKLKHQVFSPSVVQRRLPNPARRPDARSFNSRHQQEDRYNEHTSDSMIKRDHYAHGASKRQFEGSETRRKGRYNVQYHQPNPSRSFLATNWRAKQPTDKGIEDLGWRVKQPTDKGIEDLDWRAKQPTDKGIEDSDSVAYPAFGSKGVNPRFPSDSSLKRRPQTPNYTVSHRTEASLQTQTKQIAHPQAKFWQQHKHTPKEYSHKNPKKDDRQSSYATKDRSWIIKSLRFEDMLDLSRKTPDEIVYLLHSDMKGFVRTLEHDHKPQAFDCIMLLLFKVTECLQYTMSTNEVKSKASLILAEVLSPRCTHYQWCLKLYATRDILNCRSCTCQLLLQRLSTMHDFQQCRVQSLYKFFKSLLEAIPSTAWRILPIDEFIQTVKQIHVHVADVEELKQLQIQSRDLHNQPSTESMISSQHAQLTWDNSEYKTMPIFPEWQELCNASPPAKLRANIINGKYTDWMHYYDVQFRLLREDFTAPLRRGICEFLQGSRGRQLKDIRVYREAYLAEPLLSKDGICFKIKFNNSHLKHCKWKHSKRLLFGSLLCFSSDGFKIPKNVLFATVINRDPHDLEKGLLDVQFQSGTPMLNFFFEKQKLTIVESSAYFESSRHIMTSLQRAEVETMPFTTYLINNNCNTVAAPHYLQQQEESRYELKCVYQDKECNKTIHCIHHRKYTTTTQSSTVPANDSEMDMDPLFEEMDAVDQVDKHNKAHWPQLEDTMLDHSQLEALKMALTQEIAVVQGPPGTGKTFMGIKIVQTLIANRIQWDPKGESPILVMCYTNHALDQFLEGILPMISQSLINTQKPTKVIRIGGRCKSDQIGELNLKNHRHNVFLPRNVLQRLMDTEKKVASKEKEFRQALNNLTKARNCFVTFKDLEPKIVNGHPDHQYQLHNSATTQEEVDKTLELWLGLWEVHNEKQKQSDHPIQDSDLDSISEGDSEDDSDNNNYYDIPPNQSKLDNLPDHEHFLKDTHIDHEPHSVSPTLQLHLTSLDTTDEFSIKEKLSKSPKNEDGLLEVEGETLIENYAEVLVDGAIGDEDNDNDTCDIPPDQNNILLQPNIANFSQQESVELSSESASPTDFSKTNPLTSLDTSNTYSITDNLLLKSDSLENTSGISKTSDNERADEDELLEVEGEASIENDARVLDDDSNHLKPVNIQSNVAFACNPLLNQIEDKNVRPSSMPHRSLATSIPKPKIKLQAHKDYTSLLASGLRKGKFTKEEVKQHKDITSESLSIDERWKCYNYWRHKYLESLQKKCEEKIQEYNDACEQLKEIKQNRDKFALETADIIGMTTTGAAKYQHILHMVKPMIVIVEEAAEVLEAHIVSALNAGTRHLILIGDHKQLKPKPNEYNLAVTYNLEVSLFERLVRNNFPHVTLNIQHRMRPEIANLVRPHIYTSLVDHESVLKYGDVKGVKNNLFFIQHEHNETHDESLLSHSNPHEAAYLVALCLYLLRQGYKPEQITILVTYTGQLLLLRSMMPRAVFDGVLVRTVDNYQGEENDLILLSLVRSNAEGKVGFLKEDNRVCVALSRAKVGLYCIGNFNMLRENSTLWEAILKDMESKQLVGDELQLCCNNHPSIIFTAKLPNDFTNKAPDGGCLQSCQFRLQCGHVCERKCHSFDSDHTDYLCKKNCVKKCPEGHDCPKQCFEECGSCMERVTKILPRCGHNADMYCHEEPGSIFCMKPCLKLCTLEHPCPKLCSQTCKCTVKVQKIIKKCGHIQLMPCYRDPELFNCMASCEQKCKNGHLYKNKCSKQSEPCSVIVDKTLPDCSHTVRVECYRESLFLTCTVPCEKILKCGHICKEKCGQTCTRQCHARIVTTLECGHNKELPCHIGIGDVKRYGIECDKPCKKVLPCKHQCKNKCCEPCTDKCMVTVNKKWPCGHKLKRKCYQTNNPKKFPCKKKCERKLPCGHMCSNPCGQTCTTKCNTPIEKVLPCGHQTILPCHIKSETFKCDLLCKYELKCGHKCSGTCGECVSKRCHLPCKFNLQLRRFCGHTFTVQCVDLNDFHPAANKKQCLTQCVHRKCSDDCTVECEPCEQPCPWNCPHYTCTKLCHEICERPPCNEPCNKRLVNCGHPCVGVCGEPCVSVCPLCQRKQFNELLTGPGTTGYKQGELYVELRCGHIYMLKFLDQYTAHSVHEICSGPVLPISCLKCKWPLIENHRYGNISKQHYHNKLAVQEAIRVLSSIIVQHINVLEVRLTTITTESIEKVESCFLTLQVRKQRVKNGWCPDDNENLCIFKPIPLLTKHIYEVQKKLLPENAANIGPQENYLNTLLINAIEHSCAYDEKVVGNVQESEPNGLGDIKACLSKYTALLSELLDKKSRLSVQIISDTTSEMYRLSLMVQLFLLENIIHLSPSVGQPMVEPPLEVFLRILERNPSLRVAQADYVKYSKNMKEMYAKSSGNQMPVDYEVVVKDIAESTPPVLKGYWRKCEQGHYYCSPLTISKQSQAECHECMK